MFNNSKNSQSQPQNFHADRSLNRSFISQHKNASEIKSGPKIHKRGIPGLLYVIAALSTKANITQTLRVLFTCSTRDCISTQCIPGRDMVEA